MNPIPRLRQQLANEEAVWSAFRSEPAPHVEAVRRALDVDPPSVADLRQAGLEAVSAAFEHWRLPPPPDLASAAARFARVPDAGDALVGAAMVELGQARDVSTAAEGLELVLGWSWDVLRADPRDLSATAAPPGAPALDGERRTRRTLLAGLGLGLLVSAVLLADPFDWFGGGDKKKRQKRQKRPKGGKGKAGKPRRGADAEAEGVADSPPATRDAQRKQR